MRKTSPLSIAISMLCCSAMFGMETNIVRYDNQLNENEVQLECLVTCNNQLTIDKTSEAIKK